MKVIEVIKKFFEPPKVTMDELKNLSKEERRELAELAAVELGVQISE